MADDIAAHWASLSDALAAENADVFPGRMMSAEALTHGGKVFVFHSTKGGRSGLGCRIGREADPATLGLIDWQHLAPFRTKPPMKDWIVAGAGDLSRWRALAEHCLDLARKKR